MFFKEDQNMSEMAAALKGWASWKEHNSIKAQFVLIEGERLIRLECNGMHFPPWCQGKSLTVTEVSLFSLHDSSRMRPFQLSYQADHEGPAPNEQILLAPMWLPLCVFD